MAFVAAASVWGLVLWVFLRGRLGPSTRAWARSIAFEPTEPVSPEQLFGHLLGGNFALLLRDNFNQLGSALSERRIRRVLLEHWGIRTDADCLRVIQARIDGLGRMSPAERRAIAAWMVEAPIDSCEYAALEDTCRFMALRAHLTQVEALRHEHLSVLGWDIQELACLVRLARAVDGISKAFAEDVLALLKARACAHFSSWSDYSLSALVGLGLRGSLEVFDHAEWRQFARTHSVLLDTQHSPIKHASPWGGFPQPRRLSSGRAAFGPRLAH